MKSGTYRAAQRPGRSNIRGEIFWFLLLAFVVPWSGWIAVRVINQPPNTVQDLAYFWLPAGVSGSAFAVIAVRESVGGLLAFLRRTLNLRFPVIVWLAMLAPVAAATLSFVPHPQALAGHGKVDFASMAGTLTFANLWTGPLAEEFGWRGFLLSRLRRRYSLILSGLIIGAIWAAWHLPLLFDSVFASPVSACSFVLWITSWSIVLAVVTERANGSVLPAIAIHFLMNNAAGLCAALLPGIDAQFLPGGVWLTVTSMVVALSTVSIFKAWAKEVEGQP